jgi:hypothetical protein
MQDFSVWNAHHKRNYGTPGISEFFWFQGHLNLTLIGCGRLQFNTKLEFPGFSTVFRNKQTGKVLSLTDNGDRYTDKGILDDLQNEPSEGSWISTFTETPQTWTGNPVTPEGFAKSSTVTLSKSEWEVVLQKGDPVINTHIPESGPLLSEECGKSLCRARDFFGEYLSDYSWKAFFCDSCDVSAQITHGGKPLTAKIGAGVRAKAQVLATLPVFQVVTANVAFFTEIGNFVLPIAVICQKGNGG